ncbi:MAG: lytic transglycosylase domain-containing protein [Nitrospira sp.]
MILTKIDRRTNLEYRSGLRAVAIAVGLVSVIAVVPESKAEDQLYGYVSSNGTVHATNVPSDQRYSEVATPPRDSAAVLDHELEEAVLRSARDNRLAPELLLAVIKAESSFNPLVISKAGAVGLMQLIPETAIRHGVRNLYDTRDNIGGGAKHLRYLLDRFHGNIRLALAAYNAGEQKVTRYRQIPPYKETQLYVKKVMTYYREYRASGTAHAAIHYQGVR